MSLRVGLALANAGRFPVRDLVELAALAEDAGWDGVFLEDYLVWQGHQDMPTYDPWVLLGAMAQRTERIRLGALVTPLARRRPAKVVKEAVTIDRLSDGRLVLAFGLGDAGDGDPSFSRLGEAMELRRRAEQLDEGLTVVAALLGERPVQHRGRYFQVDDLRMAPAPVQQPRIPMWIGGGYPLPGPTRRALRWDGSCLYRHGSHRLTPQDVRDLRSQVRETRGSDNGYDVVVGGEPRTGNTREELARIQALAVAGMTWWQEYVPPDDLPAMRAAIARGPLRP